MPDYFEDLTDELGRGRTYGDARRIVGSGIRRDEDDEETDEDESDE